MHSSRTQPHAFARARAGATIGWGRRVAHRDRPTTAAVAAAILVACVSTSIAAASDAAEPLVAPSPGGRGRTITVVGVGREHGTPDRLDVRIAVEQTAPNAQTASQQAAKIATQVIEALRKIVGDGGRVDTAGYQLTPVYRTDNRTPARERGPEIVGYTAVNQLAVQTRRLDAVGTLIDAAIAAGAARVDSLSFTVADPAPVQAAALRAAGTDAAAQAAAVAESLHVTLKGVVEATTEPMQQPIPQRFQPMMRAEAMSAATPIEPGEVTTEARVRVTYGID